MIDQVINCFFFQKNNLKEKKVINMYDNRENLLKLIREHVSRNLIKVLFSFFFIFL